MKILHAGWAFQPYRSGGLIEYAEDLMEIQIKHGHEVFYFCTGRLSVFLTKPTLKKWKHKKGYQVFELKNPPIVSGLDFGIDKPALDVSDAATEEAFWKVVNGLKPDVVHFQEFLGIPTNVLKKLKSSGIKTIYTAEDYFPLCPTLKLVKYDQQLCMIKGPELGMECSKCCRLAPENNLLYKFESMFGLFDNHIWMRVKDVTEKVGNFISPTPKTEDQLSDATINKATLFNHRRLNNLKNLQYCDLIIAMSNKVAEIFKYYHRFDNITVLNLTLKHIGVISPYRIEIKPGQKIKFGLINVMGTILKGKDFLLHLFEKIKHAGLGDKLSFFVWGDIDRKAIDPLKAYSFVAYKGRYKAEDLNSLLENTGIDVGIVPSIWEEAYGYVGIEFIAKGVPVIGNNIGGIPDYISEHETGWLNRSCTVDEMLGIIKKIINDPLEISRMNQNICLNRKKYIKDLESHYQEMDQIYNNLLAQA